MKERRKKGRMGSCCVPNTLNTFRILPGFIFLCDVLVPAGFLECTQFWSLRSSRLQCGFSPLPPVVKSLYNFFTTSTILSRAHTVVQLTKPLVGIFFSSLMFLCLERCIEYFCAFYLPDILSHFLRIGS